MTETITMPVWWVLLGVTSFGLYVLVDVMPTRRRKSKPQKAQERPPKGGQNLELYHRTKEINDENRRLSRNVDLWRRLCLKAREERDEARTELEASKSAQEIHDEVRKWTSGTEVTGWAISPGDVDYGSTLNDRFSNFAAVKGDDGQTFDYPKDDLPDDLKPEPQTFKVGDSVFSYAYGRGEVVNTDRGKVTVKFGQGLEVCFSKADGWLTHC